MNPSLFICRIWQKNNFTFCIEWNDKKVQEFRLSDLQSNCWCANCRDELTGHSRVDPRTLDLDVRAVMIRSVGRYGLHIQFTSGCSTGIYRFEQLYYHKKNESDVAGGKK
jgi:ATP-binding protein involved in chromosome partitioning